MRTTRTSFIVVVAGLLGVLIGWMLTHAVLAVAGYQGDPSRGAAFTGAFIVGMAMSVAAWAAVRRRPAG